LFLENKGFEENILEFNKIIAAYQKCAKGKKKSLDCFRFESQLGKELTQLANDINQRTYHPGESRCFVVTNPRAREIWASSFRDRVVHHLIVDHLEPLWLGDFSGSSYACRKGKGAHAAFKDIKNAVKKISQGGRKTVWALQLDIESFFVTIDREILKELFLKRASDPEIIWLINKNFDADPRFDYKKSGWRDNFKLVSPQKSWLARGPRQGIPIGNLTSQFGANLYLHELDFFIQQSFKKCTYFRYMDDLLFLTDSKENLVQLEEKVNSWLQTYRRQNLNLHKTSLVPLTKGIDYLGFRLKQVPEPREPLIILPQRKKKWDLVREIKKLETHNWEKLEFPHELAFPLKDLQRKKLQKLNSRLSYLNISKSFLFRKQTLEKFKKTNFGCYYLKFADGLKTVKYDG